MQQMCRVISLGLALVLIFLTLLCVVSFALKKWEAEPFGVRVT